jgi:DNA-binding response OmpR family regulator
MAVTNLPLVANRIEVSSPWHEKPRVSRAASSENVVQPPNGRVLLATGDDQLRSAGHDHLTAQDYVVTTAGGGVACVALLREFTPDVVALDSDLQWGGADGVLELLSTGDCPFVPVVLLSSPIATQPGSGREDGSSVVQELEKPVGVETLLWAVRSAIGGGSTSGPGGRTAVGEESPPPPA